jgi:DNA (cytosine-5)-methyltransferase 1
VHRRVAELFAGVGGFRLGLERAGWKVVWSNQWEPGRKAQHASDCYVVHFGPEGHHTKDISTIDARDIPDHEVLTGGFPCQDYSVATTNAKGLSGRKGVLWWQIHRILMEKRPPYLLLENVDRLLKSPTAQRGRDFGVMLGCLAALGYAVEWRYLNAADYSAPQRRRRVFIFGAHQTTPVGGLAERNEDPRTWVERTGFFAAPFSVVPAPPQMRFGREDPHATLPSDLRRISDTFEFHFSGAGMMTGGSIWSYDLEPQREPPVCLGDVLERDVDERFYVPTKDLPKWRYWKGAKAPERTTEKGFSYRYAEGALPFPDPLDRPARTMLTDEGGRSPSRFKHIVRDPWTGRHRVITPVEAERLNQFDDDWTNTGMPERYRYFCMGNALVVGLVTRMGARLLSIVEAGSMTPSVPRGRPNIPVAPAS